MEVVEYFDLSPMRGLDNVANPNYMCSSMGYPHTKFVMPQKPGCPVDNPSTRGKPVSHVMRLIHE